MLNGINNLADLQVPLGGKLFGNSQGLFSRVVTDTRALKKGDLFLALKGEKYDGHDFVSYADSHGAAGFIVNRQIATDKPRLVVRDTRYALGRLGALHRLNWQGVMVAITGSNGKTTTKEMIGALLSLKGKTLITPSNENNNLGVPMTLLRLEDSHKYAAIEIGADRPGEIGYSASLTKPHIAVLINVYPSHLGGFGTMAKIAEEKGELISYSLTNGTVVLGADCQYYDLWQRMAKARKVIRFASQREDAEVRISNFRQEMKGIGFQLSLKEGLTEFYLPLLGEHNALNAAAACSVGQELGLTAKQMQAALADFKPVQGRMSYQSLGHNCLLINDSYNANPSSTRQALRALKSLSWQGKKVAILADMLDLGDKAEEEHLSLAAFIEDMNLDGLFTFGELARLFIKKGTEDSYHQAFDDKGLLIDCLDKESFSDTIFLVKGSRGMHMEEVADFLITKLGGQD